MEADFTRYYQSDLRALCWGKNPWGVRRLLTHIAHLPRDSAFVRSLSGASAYWDEQVELQAQTVDAIDRLAYYLLKVNGNDPPEPSIMQRPGVSSEPQAVSLSEFNDFLKG